MDVLTGKPNYPDGKIFPRYQTWGINKESWYQSTIYRVPLISRGNKNKYRLVANYLSFVFFGTVLSPILLRGKKYDAVFVAGVSPIIQALPGLFLSCIKKCPLILWVQDLWPESLEATGYVKNRYVLAIVGRLVSWIYKHTDKILVQSRAFIQPVENISMRQSPVLYYPNSVDDSFYNSCTTEVPYISGLDRNFSILFAGNIGTAQSVETILESAVILKNYLDISFVVMGSGSKLEWLNKKIKELKLTNISTPGRFPIEMMPSFMQKASALLVTLTDRSIFAMTVPNKVQAYMASGKPILACINGEGAKVVTEAGAGISVEAENAPSLAGAILKIYNMSNEERNKFGENGRAYYKLHYDHNKLVDTLIQHLNAAISSNMRCK